MQNTRFYASKQNILINPVIWCPVKMPIFTFQEKNDGKNNGSVNEKIKNC